MPGAVVHETKGLDIEEPDALVLDSMEYDKEPDTMEFDLGQRSCAITCLSGHFFLDLCFLCFKKGALGSNMPT
jgi:hypothetical protein